MIGTSPPKQNARESVTLKARIVAAAAVRGISPFFQNLEPGRHSVATAGRDGPLSTGGLPVGGTGNGRHLRPTFELTCSLLSRARPMTAIDQTPTTSIIKRPIIVRPSAKEK